VKDLTVVAIPFYFGSMGAEYLWLRKDLDELDDSPGAYERQDTIASLTMGVGSLLGPLVMPKLLRHVVPGKGRYGKVLLATAAGAAAVTTVADLLARLDASAPTAPGQQSTAPPGDAAADGFGGDASGRVGSDQDASGRDASGQVGSGRDGDDAGLSGRTGWRRRVARAARPVASAGGVVSVIAGGLAVTTSWAARTGMDRLSRRRLVRSLGTGPVAAGAAILAWDFIYYWNHRAMHESRFMWAIHVVHHSSERYNLSTALRQPVADAFGTFVPYSGLALLGFEPALINTARGVNLLYQFWIHTETINRIGPFERFLNTPSHHRVHHGSNGPYLDRNHGSILIIWDKLFGTFEAESEQVVYGLTKNINTFNPLRIAGHEYGEMIRDIARSRTWRDRLGYVLRGPGWAGRRRAEQLGSAPVASDATTVAPGWSRAKQPAA
jgi:sterol desaturase/sphingolipid hydroxylase (fatty acid hydroxylase superfamily)